MKDDAERILSIDYGEKRIGIAISDPLKMFAIPLITIDNNNLFFTKLKEIIEQYNFVKVVLGYPLKEDGTKTILTDKVEEFKTKLEKQFKIEVIYVDERYSSSIAWEQIKVSVKSKKKKKK